MIQIRFDSSSNNNSYSSLSIELDNKIFFFNNTHSWINREIINPIINLEYLCLPNKEDIDSITIQYEDLIYKIECSKNILINNNNVLQLRVHVNFSTYKFKKDILDHNSYDTSQIFCNNKILLNQIPSLQVNIFDDTYIFDQWYNSDNSLLFYSKDTKDLYHAFIQIFNTHAIFYMVKKIDTIKKPVVFYSISKNNLLSNEIGQIDCSEIVLNFSSLHMHKPIIVPEDYYNINTIDNNISIQTL